VWIPHPFEAVSLSELCCFVPSGRSVPVDVSGKPRALNAKHPCSAGTIAPAEFCTVRKYLKSVGAVFTRQRIPSTMREVASDPVWSDWFLTSVSDLERPSGSDPRQWIPPCHGMRRGTSPRRGVKP